MDSTLFYILFVLFSFGIIVFKVTSPYCRKNRIRERERERIPHYSELLRLTWKWLTCPQHQMIENYVLILAKHIFIFLC